MKKPIVFAATTAAVLVLPVLGACSSGSSSPSPTPSASPGGSASLANLSADQVKVEGAGTQRVAMSFPFPSQAGQLTTKDLNPGSGAAATAQSTVTVNYTGMGAITGKQFDSSFDTGKPITFPLSGVIPGWQQGIPGMKPGGERVLVIPGSLAYGSRPPPGSGIEPNETLVFYVQLVSIGS